ncbi:MAG TPA: hypothetical protein VF242_12275 [Nitrososphaeraceae archaeon]
MTITNADISYNITVDIIVDIGTFNFLYNDIAIFGFVVAIVFSYDILSLSFSYSGS